MGTAMNADDAEAAIAKLAAKADMHNAMPIPRNLAYREFISTSQSVRGNAR